MRAMTRVAAGVAAVVGLLLGAGEGRAQVTRVATFENYAEGQQLGQSFTDPVSGIAFRDSTHSSKGFSMEYSSTEFGGGNYLGAGGYVPGPLGRWSAYFGFRGDLPQAADWVGVGVTFTSGSQGDIVLRAYDAAGGMVAERAGEAGDRVSPFRLEVGTPGVYQIAYFKVDVGATATGYDNVGYRVVPEPGGVAGAVVGVVVLGMVRRAGKGASR